MYAGSIYNRYLYHNYGEIPRKRYHRKPLPGNKNDTRLSGNVRESERLKRTGLNIIPFASSTQRK